MGAVGERLVLRVEPWSTPDLDAFCRAVGAMFESLERYAYDDDAGNGGWSILFDVDRCPAEALPYLAQWVGERLPAGLDEAAMRQWIKDAPNQIRGTPQSVAHAAMRWLTGSRTVFMRERSRLDLSSDSDALAIITYAQETPNPAQVLEELEKVVPSDVMLYYTAASGYIWANVETNYATWTAVHAANATWGALASRPADFSGFTPWYR